MTDQPKKPKPGRKQIKLEIPQMLKATYANFAMIMHTGSEIVIDFAQILPNIPKTPVQARIVLSPTNARLLYNALGENLANYEKKFGAIKTPPTLAEHLFSSAVAKVKGDSEEDDPDADAQDSEDTQSEQDE